MHCLSEPNPAISLLQSLPFSRISLPFDFCLLFVFKPLPWCFLSSDHLHLSFIFSLSSCLLSIPPFFPLLTLLSFCIHLLFQYKASHFLEVLSATFSYDCFLYFSLLLALITPSRCTFAGSQKHEEHSHCHLSYNPSSSLFLSWLCHQELSPRSNHISQVAWMYGLW